MGDESAEEVEKLKTLLDEAKAAIKERERQLAETKTKPDEAEVTFAAERDEQVAAVRLECELDKLRDIEALRKNFDKERQAWYHEKEEWTTWKTAAQGEKDELLLQIDKLRKEKAHESGSGTGSGHSSPSESEEDGGGVPAKEGTRSSEGEAGRDKSATETPGSGGDSTTSPSVVGTDGVVQSVTRLLEAQTQMVAKAMVAQSFPPLPAFTGESEEENFERWLESFEDRAKVAGWSPEQSLYQLKCHLSKTALQAFRLFSKEEKAQYPSAIKAMKKRFTSVDIEELRGMEFHSLMQESQSAEQLGLQLQKLAHKAFPSFSGDDFDRLLKGRFYSALLPKWQKKLGAPRPSEKFNDLYERARTIERHDKQFQVSAAGRSEKKEGQSELPSKLATGAKPAVVTRLTGSGTSTSRESPGRPTGSGASTSRESPGSANRSGVPLRRTCFICKSTNHLARNCPEKRHRNEARGRTRPNQGNQANVSVVEASSTAKALTTQQLEDLLAERRVQEESALLESTSADVNVVVAMVGTTKEVLAIGPTMHLPVTVEGVSIEGVVDTASQSTIISRSFLHVIGQSLRRQGKPLPALVKPHPYKFYGKGGEQLVITAQTKLTVEADGRSVIVPVFVQPDSSQACLLGNNVLMHLGVKVQRANGDPVKLVGGEVNQSQVRLVQAVSVPSGKAKFVEAKLDVPLVEGEELVFEPCAETFDRHALVAPEALVTLHSDGKILVPVENHEALTVRLESDTVLGQVVRPSKAADPVVSSGQTGQSLRVEAKVDSTVEERQRKLIEVLGLKPGIGGLTIDQFEQLKKLLEENHDVFSLEGELGCTDIVQHVIDTGDHPLSSSPLEESLLCIWRRFLPWWMRC